MPRDPAKGTMGLDAAVLERGRENREDVDGADHVVPPVQLGNSATIGHLRRRVREMLPVDAILLRMVLYSGSHTGDELGAGRLPALEKGLDVLRHGDAMTRAFRRSMVMLADAAMVEGTAITFRPDNDPVRRAGRTARFRKPSSPPPAGP